MQIAGQIQSAIELLEALLSSPVPADKYMSTFFKDRRYMGSKDKGVVADISYGVLRHKGELVFVLKSLQSKIDARRLVIVYLVRHKGYKVARLCDVFNGDTYAPKAIKEGEKEVAKKAGGLSLDYAAPHERLNFNEELTTLLQDSFGDDFEEQLMAMNSRATTDIRVNTLKTDVSTLQKELLQKDVEMEKTALSPLCLRMADRKSLFHLDLFHQGKFELQDEGSQMIAQAAGVKEGMKVVDFCAGAGGKTLALAAAMKNKGTLYACDVHERRLGELPKRARRAGVHNIQTKVLSSESDKWVKRQVGKMDVVLLDAPCTGTGTWRRSPDAKWRLSVQDVQELVALQADILNSACRMVKVGGRLVYATCSLLSVENEKQVESFLSTHPDFKLVPQQDWCEGVDFPTGDVLGMTRLSPLMNQTDGFFMAVMEKL